MNGIQLLIDGMQQDGIKKLEQENKELKEQLTEQIDYKEEYYHYWQETKKENEILKKALELGCKDLTLYQDVTTTKLKIQLTMNYYVKEAKESIDGTTN